MLERPRGLKVRPAVPQQEARGTMVVGEGGVGGGGVVFTPKCLKPPK